MDAKKSKKNLGKTSVDEKKSTKPKKPNAQKSRKSHKKTLEEIKSTKPRDYIFHVKLENNTDRIGRSKKDYEEQLENSDIMREYWNFEAFMKIVKESQSKDINTGYRKLFADMFQHKIYELDGLLNGNLANYLDKFRLGKLSRDEFIKLERNIDQVNEETLFKTNYLTLFNVEKYYGKRFDISDYRSEGPEPSRTVPARTDPELH